LVKVQARFLSEVDGPNESKLAFYALPNGQVIIVQWFAEFLGFEMYCTINTSGLIADTFEMLEQLAAIGNKLG
jgi:hypothetical protein